MPIIFRLIGNANIDNFNINHNTNLPENIKLFDIINIFKEFGLDDDDFQYIKFAVDNKLIKDNIILSNHEKNPLNVFLFTPNNNIKEKLINIFSKRGYNPYDNTNENAKNRNTYSVNLVPTESAGESDEDSAVEPAHESDEDSAVENGKESGEEVEIKTPGGVFNYEIVAVKFV